MPDLVGGINFTIRKLPGLGLLSGTVEGIRHEHTREDTDNDFSFHLNLSGLSIVAARGSEATLRDGDAMLLSDTESRTITRPGPVHHRVIRLPRASLAPLVRNIDDAVLRGIPRGTGALSLLSNYAGTLIDEPALRRHMRDRDQLCARTDRSLERGAVELPARVVPHHVHLHP